MIDATDNQKKALRIISNNYYLSAYLFATIMWKDSNMMKHKGWKIARNGASYLYKLRRRGWVVEDRIKGWSLTEEGRQQIAEE